MLHQPTPHRGSCRSAIALLALLVHVSANAETPDPSSPKTDLEPLIVSALQVARDASTVASAVTVLDPESLRNKGVFQLRDALNEVPGVISTSTSGQTGAPGNLFIRGTSTKHAQIVIDGMRLNDSNNQLGNILSRARTYDVGSIEVLRGPQGAVYGGESIGGVLWMETPHGSGEPHGSTTVEAGSFQSCASYAMFQGESGDFSYYLSGGYEETDNDAPNNHFYQDSTALRVEGKINPVWSVGTTFRGMDSSGQDLDTNWSVNGESDVTSALSTVYAVGKISDRWTARFHAGYYQESLDQSYIDTWVGPSIYFNELRAGSVSTDHEIKIAENLRFLLGVFAHQDSYKSSNGTDKKGTRYGAHTTLEWDVVDHLTSTASLRWEDYDAYGSQVSWRFGSIYTLAPTGTILRGGIGTSFRAPNYMELFDSSWGPGNPNLRAESSMGWDLGIEQQICDHHTIDLTWFRNKITDQIVSPFTWPPSPAENVAGESTTEGLEVGLRGSWLDHALSYRIAWTYLNESLKKDGQPRNAATASLDWKPTPKSLIGIGATHLSAHPWTGTQLDAYTVARIHASYQITEKVKLHARLENALDKNYELYNGYGSVVQGTGAGLYAGITVDW